MDKMFMMVLCAPKLHSSIPRICKPLLRNSSFSCYKTVVRLLHCSPAAVHILLPTAMGKPKTKHSCSLQLCRGYQPPKIKKYKDGANVNNDYSNTGNELTGKLKKGSVSKVLREFKSSDTALDVLQEHGIALDSDLAQEGMASFYRYCLTNLDNLPVDLHVTLSDLTTSSTGHIDDIIPFFIRHIKDIYPHLDCMDDLKHISDLRNPANWYVEARTLKRNIIIHAGPTNSGKTYHALERFMKADSGIYCGPLKMLAVEVFEKCKEEGVYCDLVTGDERVFANPNGEQSNHISCTIEMASVSTQYEVAVIDEIQMMRDYQRGGAWTRALLGLCAKEIHVCGEASSIELIKELMSTTGDHVEVRKYDRLTKLSFSKKSLDDFEKVQPGDCIVTFSKKDLYYVCLQLEQMGKQVAIIYGNLPPSTKRAQAQKFNDPNDPCKILVATDAIGMGLNLSIRRIIFYSCTKMSHSSEGKVFGPITTSQALQIGGRAGRYKSQYEEGIVTTFKSNQMETLLDIISRPLQSIQKAGLFPSADHIELFSFHLPHMTFTDLLNLFTQMSVVDNGLYFLCYMDDFKQLSKIIDHISLELKVRYAFCGAPVDVTQPFVCTMFIKFARCFSRGEAIGVTWMKKHTSYPYKSPKNLPDLVHLEFVFDVLDLYLWFNLRFPYMFPESEGIKTLLEEVEILIQDGINNVTKLVRLADVDDYTEITETRQRAPLQKIRNRKKK